MKRILWIAVLTLCCSQGLQAQLNPVDTLIFEQGYSFGSYCPSYNCFNLFWTEPAAGNDTLVGYNIYRNSEFYRFTNDTGIGCYESTPCDYNDFYDALPFWITVRAVYNTDSLLSAALDSVKVADILINVNDLFSNEIRLIKNPVTMGELIRVSLPGETAKKCQAIIYSADAKCLSRQDLIIQDGVVAIPSARLSSGIYILRLIIEKKEFTVKVFVE